jgi:hypothetical protein
MAKKKQDQKRPMGWSEACRDVVVTSINRGQLPLLGAIAIVLLVIFKIPESQIVDLVNEITSKLSSIAILSYLLNIVLVIAWGLHSKSVRQMHSRECDRVGREKTKLQLDQLKNHHNQEEDNG